MLSWVVMHWFSLTIISASGPMSSDIAETQLLPSLVKII